jgi:predicted transposase/invertase (TIGR01784 family)
MIPGIDPKVDYAFKRLFGSVRNLSLLNAVLRPPPDHRVVDLELLNPFTDKEALDDKLAVLDVKARDQAGRLFNVEMQLFAHRKYFPQRLLYYWARLYAQQLHEGDNYALLRPTISVCLVNDLLFPDVAAYHLRFGLWDTEHQVRFTEDLAVHVLELPKFARAVEQLTDPLEVWLYFLRHAETLDTTALPTPLTVPPIRQALEELQMLSQNDRERERYEARRKQQRDAISLIKALESDRAEGEERALKKGREEGRQEGRQEGREEGLRRGLVGRIHLSQRLLHQEPTPEGELLGRSSEELTRLAGQLEQALLNRPQ